MATRYPEMHAASKLTNASFEDFLPGAEPADLVYTRGATFELVHPSFPLVKHVCRVAKRYALNDAEAAAVKSGDLSALALEAEDAERIKRRLNYHGI